MKERIYGPEMNDGKHVLLFGSNSNGVHGAGAALDAIRYWGAMPGIGAGRVGNSYAIPTKRSWRQGDRQPLTVITTHVGRFLRYACDHPEITFLVTRIGCGLAGFEDKDIAPMFKGAPKNCVLPEGWR